MFNHFLKKFASGFWKIIALLLLFMFLSPGAVTGAELIFLLDMLGADLFLLMYLSGMLLYFQPVGHWLKVMWKRYFGLSGRASFGEEVNFLMSASCASIIFKMPSIISCVALIAGFYWIFTSLAI